MSHMRTRRSAPPLASVDPSGEKATAQTPCEWPRNVFTSRQSVVQYSKKSTGGADAAVVSEAAFTSEGFMVDSNMIDGLLFSAACSLIEQQPAQYNSLAVRIVRDALRPSQPFDRLVCEREGGRVDAERTLVF